MSHAGADQLCDQIPQRSGRFVRRPTEPGAPRDPAPEWRPSGVTGSLHALPGATERELVIAAQQSEPEARARLVAVCTPLIGSVARMYRGSTTVNRGELMQEGIVGLLRALERYDADFGTPFWAYASWWVRQAMQQLVSELTRPVVLSDRAVRQLARVKDAHRSLAQTQGAEPSTGELAAETGLARAQVERLIAAERMPRGLEEPIGGEDGAGTFGELLADPCAEDAYDQVPPRLGTRELGDMLRDLTDRERDIVRARYGLDGVELTLRELGERFGVSAERVRQIEQQALEKLRTSTPAALTRSERDVPTGLDRSGKKARDARSDIGTPEGVPP
jgi:RNA polymerase primary sigma factor